MTTLIISNLDDDVETIVGKLHFEAGSEPTLSTESTGPDAEALQLAWQAISLMDEVPMATTEITEEDGEEVTEFGETLVAKDDSLYPMAVWSALEERYHYIVDCE